MSTPLSRKYTQLWKQDQRDGVVIPCGICGLRIGKGSKSNRGGLTVDHIYPLSWGGRDTLGNIQPAHSKCNAVKGNQIKISKEDLERGLKKLGVKV